ncbi:hypothetical protein F0562_013876 [Nyssa sinensis]|uniref:RRM domain-containing protein n=1 Tax=Nyssa sinensis TaxID=561372 RepID=A0A5J4ZNX7_9ASTE|nr:hypothetical protein F0562_013876 [Nyssa sinensis]
MTLLRCGTFLHPEDVRNIILNFTIEQLLDIVQNATVRHLDVLDAVRSIADADLAKRKLFIRGLGWETTTQKLRNIFSSFGELEEAIIITDNATGKSKGYGFVTFKHIDGASLALKEPSKKVDGRMTVTQLAALGISGANAGNGVDVSLRKIYFGNITFEISSERLLDHFLAYREIEEGPLGFDKQPGKVRGFAFFVYKTEESARVSLVDPMKTIDGHQVVCKLAVDGKKGKPGAPNMGSVWGVQAPTRVPDDVGGGDRLGIPPPRALWGSLNSNYGVPGGLSSYGGFSGGQPTLAHQNPYLNSPLPASSGSSGFGNQGPTSLGTGGGYGASLGGGSASDSGNYGLSSSTYPNATQLHQPSAGPRVPPDGMYQGMPPYY